MKYLYPTAHLIQDLPPPLLSLKIARHSPCSLCSCSGLNPPPGIHVVTDDTPIETSLGGLSQYGSDEEENPSYLSICACSHSVNEHGADEHEIGSEEFRRRSLVAIRLDELLQDVGKLLDFEYTDEDIANLRQRMKLPVSIVAPSHDLSPGKHCLQ
ncbi:hypothetical protein K435DRAFT_653512 [Dendrothele bispora CBS 962.96]|uniref:Uncharacterized protein n=1 Tax=Dendrothele bispora (strain CBS 962.96) TaxID=1314807 RepID=A0A4S8MI67_DENBC|nr:hypothetical protein K435DRAFT_653512 [Dendrothele bispora CBS 962.96]